ncbi:MAG: dihydrolipoyllysine-residue acetyltransferase [Gammaproteobacteria bacterium]|nr:dihydrolipoyllysine-residue acetyltransferase [Gammaproteobacteria bacterium]
MAIETIKVPDIGDAKEVEVIELLVSVGQSVAENDSLLVLESDKAAMEIPAPMAGVVKSILVNLGDQVTTGSEMLTLEIADVTAAAKALPAKPATVAAAQPAAKAAEKSIAPASAPAPAAQAAAAQTIAVPDLGTDDEVEVIEVHVQAGDKVALEDALLTLESDKAAMDVPAPQAGTIESILVKVGDKVKTGTPFAKLIGAGTTASAAPAPVAAPATAASVNAPAATAMVPKNSVRPYAGPAVRKLARELGVTLGEVKGTGAKSRILKEDIHEFVRARINAPAGSNTATIAAIPDIDFSQFGDIEQVPRSKLQRLTAINMHRSWTAVPQVAQFNEADVTDLEEFRESLKLEAERRGTKLTFMPFLLKACARTLREYPQFNVSLHSSGDYVIQKKYVHIGVAVATEAGLVVPVIRNVDQKSIWQLGDEAAELADKAKQRKLKPEDMQGACFTISSLGAIGGTGFIPIVNAPEVAILGVGKTQIKPVYIDGQFVPRKMLPFTLSYDHKAVNGVDGGLFATYLAKLLADIRHLAL